MAVELVFLHVVGGEEVPDAFGAVVGGPASAALGASLSQLRHGRPMAARSRQQVERPELVHADNNLWVTCGWGDFPISQVVELEDPVLLGFKVWGLGLFEGLYGLKRNTPFTQQQAMPFMANVLDHPLGDQELSELGQAPGGKRQAVVHGTRESHLLDLAPLAQCELGWVAAGVARVQGLKAVGVEVVDDFPHP